MKYIINLIIKILNYFTKNNETENNILKNENKINYKIQYYKKEKLLTKEELKFYKLLKQITNKYNLNLFVQVALYEIIKNKQKYDGSFNKIKSKTIDFVITDENTKPKICIELDDYTHKRKDRQKRDKFINELFEQMEIKLLRIPVKDFYNIEIIENKIKESIN